MIVVPTENLNKSEKNNAHEGSDDLRLDVENLVAVVLLLSMEHGRCWKVGHIYNIEQTHRSPTGFPFTGPVCRFWQIQILATNP